VRRPRRGVSATALALAFWTVAATSRAQTEPPPAADEPVETMEAPAGAAPAIGSGAYHYRMTLRDDEGRAVAATPFALSLNKGVLPFVPEAKKVWRGVTDDQGHTPVFALADRIDAKDVLLRRRLGDGPLGEQMHIVSSVDGEPLVSMPYRLVLCTEPPQQFAGLSDSDGYTAYAASSAPAHILLYVDGEADFTGRDGHLFWNEETTPVEPLEAAAAEAMARQLKANRKACRKS
jgi:hypothetical protein